MPASIKQWLYKITVFQNFIHQTRGMKLEISMFSSLLVSTTKQASS